MIFSNKNLYLFFCLLSIGIIFSSNISPVYFWGIGIITFFIPLILFLNLIGFITYFFTKKRFFITSAIVIILGMNHITSSIGIGFTPNKENSISNESISIISHNIGSYKIDSKKNYKNYSGINLNKFDIICFQEFVKSNADSTIQNFQKIAGIENYYYYYTGKVMTPKDLGLITFSRYPIINSGKILFGTNSFNGIHYIDVRIVSDTVRIYNAHFKSYNSREIKTYKKLAYVVKKAIVERSERTKEVLEQMSKCKYKIILAGDFNEHPYGYVYHQFTDKLMDTIVGTSFFFPRTIYRFPARIDYIMVDKKLRVEDFGIFNNISISDHFPIHARISIK